MRNCESCWTAKAEREVTDDFDKVWQYCTDCARKVGQVSDTEWEAFEAARAARLEALMASLGI